VERAFFAERDHFFRQWADGLGFGKGGFDAFVFDEAANLIREQSVAMSV
jgi:hypothetical protein